MTETFRTLSARMFRDVLYSGILVIFLFAFRESSFKIADFPVTYGAKSALLLTFICSLLFISISSHLLKAHLLMRRIDSEVKLNYSVTVPIAAQGGWLGLFQAIYKASHLTSFVLSDNFLMDVIISGHKRIPTLKRTLSLQFMIIIGFSLVSARAFEGFIVPACLLDSRPLEFYVTGILTLVFLILYLVIGWLQFRFFFVGRSLLLARTQRIRHVYSGFLRVYFYLETSHQLSLLPNLNVIQSLQSNPPQMQVVQQDIQALSNVFAAFAKFKQSHQQNLGPLLDTSYLKDFLDIPNHDAVLNTLGQSMLDTLGPNVQQSLDRLFRIVSAVNRVQEVPVRDSAELLEIVTQTNAEIKTKEDSLILFHRYHSIVPHTENAFFRGLLRILAS